jgi:biofilm PGA synthesis N-glycosyltransferase PgaC
VELKRIRVYVLLAVLLASLALLAGMSFQSLRNNEGAYLILFENAILASISTYLLFILGILLVRYAILMVYSFLDHLESLRRIEAAQDIRPDDQLPMVSLVVPAFNEGVVIQPALRSLLELDYPNYEVIVVDDGSTDDTYDKAMAVAAESQRVPVRVLTKRNGGKAEALNTGMAVARGELILNMDGDTKLSRNTLRVCVPYFDNPRVGAVAGNVKVVNRENLWSKIQALEYVEGLAMARKAQSFVRAVNIIPGPLGMFRKSVLREVGGYDHDTFAEDCDLTLKMLMRGWHVVYEHRAVAWVETPTSLLNLLKQRYRWTRGILQATTKHRWALWQPGRAGVNFFILWYMLFEGVIWPFTNVLANVFFIYASLQYGLISLLFYWWLQLTILDVVAAGYCVIIEDEDPGLILHSLFFRLFYIVIIDIAKVFATIEEWRGQSMTWGKLEREGKL